MYGKRSLIRHNAEAVIALIFETYHANK